MKYRTFPNLGWKPSALGFGAMRLPTIGGNPADVDIPQTVRMIRYAIDNGINYLDTAYFYHSGNSEVAVGEALKDGYRDKIRLATKFPIRYVKTPADFDRVFEEQLARLNTDRVDFYLLHGLNRRNWPLQRDLSVLQWMERKVSEGRLGYLGFSFHDDYEMFKEIVDAYDNWTFCQLHFNYMDVDYQAGRRGVRCKERTRHHHYGAAEGWATGENPSGSGGQSLGECVRESKSGRVGLKMVVEFP